MLRARQPAWISQLNLSGEAVPFSALGGVSSFEAGVPGNYPDLVVDNSGHEGGLYANVGFSGFQGWKADGTQVHRNHRRRRDDGHGSRTRTGRSTSAT